ncbi:MAG: hypothetical protein Q7T30_01800, partial [Planctomycetota bacterium]|nr:hypothetical protein [Planctomycetota bacterium]
MRSIPISILAGCLLASASAQTVFSTDFDAALPSQFAPGTATLTAVQGYAGHGPAGNLFGGTFLRSETGNVVTLTLTGLPAHDVLRLDFLFAAIDSLDGAGTYPLGDYFKITLDGATICREAFANAVPTQIQTYVPPLGVELARHQDLGFTTGPGTYFTDSAYWLGGDPFFAALPHSAASAVLTFVVEGPGVQPLADESWAMDNLRVRVGMHAQGTAVAYGLSCGPELRATSVPRLGQTLGWSLTALPPNTALAIASFGLSRTLAGASVLPMPLDGNGMPGCWLVADLGFGTLPAAVVGTAATLPIPIPNALALVGLQVFSQGWAMAPGANGAGLVTSNGLRIRVGLSAPSAILEDFQDDTHLDRDRSGGTWAFGIANFASIGGDGRHGTFAPELGQSLGLINGKRTFQFDTDNTVIPGANTIPGTALAVTDGRFFFDTMVVPADVRLRFVGTSPPQFTVVGRLDIQGEIDVAGQSIAAMPLNTVTVGQTGGLGGIFGGNGGQGGDKCLGFGAQVNHHGRNGQDARVLAGRAYAASIVGSGGRGSTVFPANGLSTSLIFGTGGTVMYSPSACAGGAGGGNFAAGQP